MSTKWELRSSLRDEIRIDPNGKIWSDLILDTYIKQAIFQIQKDWNFEWRENQWGNNTFSLVPWTQEYDLPSDFIRTDLVRYNGQVLQKTTQKQLKQLYTSFTSGTPFQYYILGSKIWFDVLPNDAWTIDFDYFKRLNAPLEDTNLSPFPEDFNISIIKYASYLAWSSPRGNEQTAITKKNEYDVLINWLTNAYIFYDTNDLNFSISRGKVWVNANAIEY